LIAVFLGITAELLGIRLNHMLNVQPLHAVPIETKSNRLMMGELKNIDWEI